MLVLEHASRDPSPDIAGLVASDARTYGDTSLTFYAPSPQARPLNDRDTIVAWMANDRARWATFTERGRAKLAPVSEHPILAGQSPATDGSSTSRQLS